MLDRRACLQIPAPAATPMPALAGDQPADLTAELEAIRAELGLPALAAAVVRAGVIAASGATGVRSLASNTRVTINDRFHIGSDTKAFTATLAGMMVESGKLQWNATLGDVLGSDVRGLNGQLAAVTMEVKPTPE